MSANNQMKMSPYLEAAKKVHSEWIRNNYRRPARTRERLAGIKIALWVAKGRATGDELARYQKEYVKVLQWIEEADEKHQEVTGSWKRRPVMRTRSLRS